MIHEGNSLTWLSEIEEDPTDLALDHRMDISGSIYTRMNELNMTQKDLAEATGMDRSQISRIITGKQNLTLATLAKLESALHFRLDSGFVYRPSILQGSNVATIPAPNPMQNGSRGWRNPKFANPSPSVYGHEKQASPDSFALYKEAA